MNAHPLRSSTIVRRKWLQNAFATVKTIFNALAHAGRLLCLSVRHYTQFSFAAKNFTIELRGGIN